MKLLNGFKKYIIVFITLLLAGCAMPLVSLTDLNELGKDEIIFVGKVQLSPQLKKDEVIYKNVLVLGGSKDDLHKVLYLKVSDTFYTLGGNHAMDMVDSVATTDGEYFYFAWNKDKPLNILGTSFITRWSSTNRETMTFSIKKGLAVKQSGKSKAVYIGNITFVRDEFFNLKKIDINQKGLKKAQKAFQKKFKTKWKLKKAKLSSAR